MKLSIPAGVLPERAPMTHAQKVNVALDFMEQRLNVVHNCISDILDEINNLHDDLRHLNILNKTGETPNDTV